jgi:hypothetical protein
MEVLASRYTQLQLPTPYLPKVGSYLTSRMAGTLAHRTMSLAENMIPAGAAASTRTRATAIDTARVARKGFERAHTGASSLNERAGGGSCHCGNHGHENGGEKAHVCFCFACYAQLGKDDYYRRWITYSPKFGKDVRWESSRKLRCPELGDVRGPGDMRSEEAAARTRLFVLLKGPWDAPFRLHVPSTEVCHEVFQVWQMIDQPWKLRISYSLVAVVLGSHRCFKKARPPTMQPRVVQQADSIR